MRSLYAIPILVINTMFMGSLSLLALIISPSGRLSHVIARYWSRCILVTCGVRIRLQGMENIHTGSSYIVMANHQSHLDIPILFAYLPLQFRIMAKKPLFMIPFLGWHLWLSGHIPIDRKSRQGRARGLMLAAEKVKKGVSLVIFPEGTRSYDGQPGLFKFGGFRLALTYNLPILPVTIDGSHRVLPKGSAWLRSAAPVSVTIHPVVPVDPSTDRQILTENVRSTIVKALPVRNTNLIRHGFNRSA